MKVSAAVQVGRQNLQVKEFDVDGPAAAADGALLRVEASGMCGSDYEQYNGEFADVGFHVYPVIPGHEPVGRIEAIGETTAQLWGVAAGDLVAVEPFCPCGICARCTEGQYQLCKNRFLYGFSSTEIGSGLWGGFAEYMQLRPNSVVHKIPDGVSAHDAVLFNPLGAGFEWSVRAAGTQIGDTVLILGPGQRGLAGVIAAREAGAGQVIVTGRGSDAHRLELARQFGASTVIDVDAENTVERVHALTSGEGADRVIDTTPYATQPVLDAIEAVRPGGTIVSAGLKARSVPSLDTDKLVLRDVTLRGVIGVKSWAYRQAIRIIASKRYPLHLMHTHTVGLDRVADGILTLAGKVDDAQAIHVTVFPGGEPR
jgi:threonine dehydrogenase-like Zn-dependent dehydrogenase